MMGIQLYTGRTPAGLSIKTMRERLKRVPDEFTFIQFCELNGLTEPAGRNTINSLKKYRMIEKLPVENQFKPCTYRKVK